MKTEDHLILGRELSENILDLDNGACRAAFLFGNIYPDINVTSYLRGFLSSKTLRGHNFESARDYVRRLCLSLGESKSSGVIYYFRLGVLIHFVADFFTYPHNGEFSGSLSEHIEYENKLHETLKAELLKKRPRGFFTGDFLWGKLLKLHSEYIENVGSTEHDARYIRFACETAAIELSYAPKKGEAPAAA